MDLLKAPPSTGSELGVKLNERTTFSLHLLLVIITLVVWLVRLSDEVQVQAKMIRRLERAVFHEKDE